MNNPFKYSLDNKRYHTWNYYAKSKYGTKVYKVPLDAGFSCPNRDGSKSTLGCLYCKGGSDGFPELKDDNLYKQFQLRKPIFTRKWHDGLPLAYFQSYTNTYASLEVLKEIYKPFIEDESIAGLVIATRPDCLKQDLVDYLNSVDKEIWLEIGLQSIHDKTLEEMNRSHSYKQFLDCIEMISKTHLKVSVHLINGWPSENEEMMIETAKEIGKLPIHAVKFHMLHILKGTPLGDKYLSEPFELLTKEKYVEIVAKQLTYLNEEIVIERLTGDGLAGDLLAPEWTIKKVSVINDIDKYMAKNNLMQGQNYRRE